MYGSIEIFNRRGIDNNYEDIDFDMDFEMSLLESDVDVLFDVSFFLFSFSVFVK